MLNQHMLLLSSRKEEGLTEHNMNINIIPNVPNLRDYINYINVYINYIYSIKQAMQVIRGRVT